MRNLTLGNTTNLPRTDRLDKDLEPLKNNYRAISANMASLPRIKAISGKGMDYQAKESLTMASIYRLDAEADRIARTKRISREALYDQAGFDRVDYFESFTAPEFLGDESDIRMAEDIWTQELRAAERSEKRRTKRWLPKAVVAGAMAAALIVSGCTGGPSPQAPSGQAVQTGELDKLIPNFEQMCKSNVKATKACDYGKLLDIERYATKSTGEFKTTADELVAMALSPEDAYVKSVANGLTTLQDKLSAAALINGIQSCQQPTIEESALGGIRAFAPDDSFYALAWLYANNKPAGDFTAKVRDYMKCLYPLIDKSTNPGVIIQNVVGGARVWLDAELGGGPSGQVIKQTPTPAAAKRVPVIDGVIEKDLYGAPIVTGDFPQGAVNPHKFLKSLYIVTDGQSVYTAIELWGPAIDSDFGFNRCPYFAKEKGSNKIAASIGVELEPTTQGVVKDNLIEVKGPFIGDQGCSDTITMTGLLTNGRQLAIREALSKVKRL